MGKWNLIFSAERAFATPIAVFLAGHIGDYSDNMLVIVFHFVARPQLKVSLPWQIEEAKDSGIFSDRRYCLGQVWAYVIPELTANGFPVLLVGSRCLLDGSWLLFEEALMLYDLSSVVELTRSCRKFHRGLVGVQRILGDDESREAINPRPRSVVIANLRQRAIKIIVQKTPGMSFLGEEISIISVT